MKIGRPVKNIDQEELKSLMQFYPSLEETSGWFDCSPDTICNFIKSNYQLTFTAFRNRYMAKTKINLKRIAIMKALDGNDKMLLFCLRALTDLDDKPEMNAYTIASLNDNDLIEQAKVIINKIESSRLEEI